MTKAEFINSVIGKPWSNRACTFDAMDCWGLVVLYYRHVIGKELHHIENYESGSDFVTCHDEEEKHWLPVGVASVGDIAVFYHAGRPAHIGVIISPGMCLHSRGEFGAVRIDNVYSMLKVYRKVEYKTHGKI